ncbi:hypothetical protein EKO27_g11346, partial [Xylaria grammica]
ILTQAPHSKPSSATISFSNGHNTSLTLEPLTGHSVYGTAYYGSFTAPHTSVSNATSFRVLTAQIPPSTAPSSSSSFAIQSTYAILPSQTTFSSSSNGTINLTIAVRAGAATTDLSARITVPVAQPLTLGPKLRTAEVKLEKGGEGEEPGGYTLWRGGVTVEEAPTGAVSVRLVRGGETLDTLLLDVGVAGW